MSEENLIGNTCLHAFYYIVVHMRSLWGWEENRRESGRCSISVYLTRCAEPSGSGTDCSRVEIFTGI